jgi:hypothetical protein
MHKPEIGIEDFSKIGKVWKNLEKINKSLKN